MSRLEVDKGQLSEIYWLPRLQACCKAASAPLSFASLFLGQVGEPYNHSSTQNFASPGWFAVISVGVAAGAEPGPA